MLRFALEIMNAESIAYSMNIFDNTNAGSKTKDHGQSVAQENQVGTGAISPASDQGELSDKLI